MKMPTSPSSSVLAVAALSFLLAGCDDPSSVRDPGASLRGKGFTVTYKQPPGGKFTLGITPWDGGGDPTAGPVLDPGQFYAALDEVTRNADVLVAGSHVDSQVAADKCPALCKEAGSYWTEEVRAEGSYDAGDPELVESDDGSLRWEADVYAEYDLQCVCE